MGRGVSVTDTEKPAGGKVDSRNGAGGPLAVTATESARARLVKNRNDKQLFRQLLGPATEEVRRAVKQASEAVECQRAAGEFSDPREGFWRAAEEVSKHKPPEEREALRLAEEARKTASVCGNCGRSIQGDEVVYWDVGVYVGMYHVFGIGPKYWGTVVCEDCAPEYMKREAKGEPLELSGGYLSYRSRFAQLPCGVCDRGVVGKKSKRDYRRPMAPMPEKPGWSRVVAFCCERCRWTFYNDKRNRRNAAAREKVCEVCGEPYTATRADAKTCGPACKQKAYRQRKKEGAA